MSSVRFSLLLISAAVLASAASAGVSSESFGQTKDGDEVTAFTITNDAGMTVRILDYGATVQSLSVPDRDGNAADVVLGFDTVAGYEGPTNPFFGCTVGRYANRIGGASFELDGKTVSVTANTGEHHIHGGGDEAFSRVIWNGKPFENENGSGVEFRHVSPDGSEGFPGKVTATVRFIVPDKQNTLRIRYAATTDAPTVLNLTNHSYFNLHGHDGPPVVDHRLKIDADAYTAVDDDLIATGETPTVEGTPYDFREPKKIGKDVGQTSVGGRPIYDLNYVLNGYDDTSDAKPRTVARVFDPDTGRAMIVRTTEPGVQLYTGRFDQPFKGKGDVTYEGRASFCLETQHFPGTPNQPDFPSAKITPDEPYRSITAYEFRTWTKDAGK